MAVIVGKLLITFYPITKIPKNVSMMLTLRRGIPYPNTALHYYLHTAVNRFLNTSKLEYRIIFVRRYWYSDSILDIAKRYGISESRVKSILHRMRGKLRIFLEKEGIVL